MQRTATERDSARHSLAQFGFHSALALSICVIGYQGASEAHPWEFPRATVEPYYLHGNLALITGLQFELDTTLSLAEVHGHVAHLEQAARRATAEITELASNNPLKKDEADHLLLALHELEAYLAPTDRSPDALRPHYSHVRNAIENLKWIHRRLKVETGLPLTTPRRGPF